MYKDRHDPSDRLGGPAGEGVCVLSVCCASVTYTCPPKTPSLDLPSTRIKITNNKRTETTEEETICIFFRFCCGLLGGNLSGNACIHQCGSARLWFSLLLSTQRSLCRNLANIYMCLSVVSPCLDYHSVVFG